jgi:hypothetical protein
MLVVSLIALPRKDKKRFLISQELIGGDVSWLQGLRVTFFSAAETLDVAQARLLHVRHYGIDLLIQQTPKKSRHQLAEILDRVCTTPHFLIVRLKEKKQLQIKHSTWKAGAYSKNNRESTRANHQL